MRRTKEDAEQTRQDILRAAINVFYKKGVAKATLCEIARHANVTRGAIYWHFSNKLEIFETLFETIHNPFVTKIKERLNAGCDNPLKQLHDTCVDILVDLDKDPYQKQCLRLFFSNMDYSGELAPLQDSYRAKKRETKAVFADYFKQAQQKGDCCEGMDPEMMAQSLACYLRGIVSDYLDHEDNFDIQVLAPKMMEIYFRKAF